MPRKSLSPAIQKEGAASTTDSKQGEQEITPRRSARAAAKQDAVARTVEGRRSRRSSTAAQTAASVAESRVTRSRSQSNRRDSTSSDSRNKSSVKEANLESPASRVKTSRRSTGRVNYKESDGEEEISPEKVEEEEYNIDEDVDESDAEETGRRRSRGKAPVKSPVKGRGSKGRGQNVKQTVRGRGRSSRTKQVADDDVNTEDIDEKEEKNKEIELIDDTADGVSIGSTRRSGRGEPISTPEGREKTVGRRSRNASRTQSEIAHEVKSSKRASSRNSPSVQDKDLPPRPRRLARGRQSKDESKNLKEASEDIPSGENESEQMEIEEDVSRKHKLDEDLEKSDIKRAKMDDSEFDKMSEEVVKPDEENKTNEKRLKDKTKDEFEAVSPSELSEEAMDTLSPEVKPFPSPSPTKIQSSLLPSHEHSSSPSKEPTQPSSEECHSSPSKAHSASPLKEHPSSPSQDHSPSPSKEHPPSPSKEHPSTPSKEHPPTPSKEHPPTPSKEHPPTPSKEHPPTPSKEHPPTPSKEHPPTPSKEHPPTPSKEHPPTPLKEHPPTPPKEHPPTPSKVHSPTPKEHLPPPSKEHPPPPSKEHPPTPSKGHPPTPSKEHPPTPSKEHPPTPSKEHPPTPSKEHPPTPSKEHPPTPSKEHPPTPSKEHHPTPSKEHPPAPSKERPPASSKEHPPTPSKEHPPTPSKEHPPTPSKGHPPTPSKGHPPTPSKGHSPTPSKEHPPAPSKEHPPAPSKEHPPAPSKEHPLAPPKVQHPPTPPKIHPSATSREHSPLTSKEHSMSPSKESLTLPSKGHLPSTKGPSLPPAKDFSLSLSKESVSSFKEPPPLSKESFLLTSSKESSPSEQLSYPQSLEQHSQTLSGQTSLICPSAEQLSALPSSDQKLKLLSSSEKPLTPQPSKQQLPLSSSEQLLLKHPPLPKQPSPPPSPKQPSPPPSPKQPSPPPSPKWTSPLSQKQSSPLIHGQSSPHSAQKLTSSPQKLPLSSQKFTQAEKFSASSPQKQPLLPLQKSSPALQCISPLPQSSTQQILTLSSKQQSQSGPSPLLLGQKESVKESRQPADVEMMEEEEDMSEPMDVDCEPENKNTLGRDSSKGSHAINYSPLKKLNDSKADQKLEKKSTKVEGTGDYKESLVIKPHLSESSEKSKRHFAGISTECERASGSSSLELHQRKLCESESQLSCSNDSNNKKSEAAAKSTLTSEPAKKEPSFQGVQAISHGKLLHTDLPSSKEPVQSKISDLCTSKDSKHCPGSNVGNDTETFVDSRTSSGAISNSSSKLHKTENIPHHDIHTEDLSLNGETGNKSHSCLTPNLPVLSGSTSDNKDSLNTSVVKEESIAPKANGTHDALHGNMTTPQGVHFGLLSRKYVLNPSLNEETRASLKSRMFGFVSYNIGSAFRDPSQNEKFLAELNRLQADIICLQEVKESFHKDILEPSLDALGYKGIISIPEGCTAGLATFYKKSSFHVVSHKGASLQSLIKKDLEASSLDTEDKTAVNTFLKKCGNVLFTQLSTLVGAHFLMVANVLLPPSDISTQALQMSCLAREVVTMMEGSIKPVLLCGAFNMAEGEAAYQLLQDGYLSNEMIEELQSRKDIVLPGKENAALVNLLWKAFQHPSSNLCSCYTSVLGHELRLPADQSTSPDLLWFSSDCLQTIGVLDVVPATVGKTEGIHCTLKADIAFTI